MTPTIIVVSLVSPRAGQATCHSLFRADCNVLGILINVLLMGKYYCIINLLQTLHFHYDLYLVTVCHAFSSSGLVDC